MTTPSNDVPMPPPTGDPVVLPGGPSGKPIYKKWWAWLIAGLLLLFIIVGLSDGSSTSTAARPSAVPALQVGQSLDKALVSLEEAGVPADEIKVVGWATSLGSDVYANTGFSIENIGSDEFIASQSVCGQFPAAGISPWTSIKIWAEQSCTQATAELDKRRAEETGSLTTDPSAADSASPSTSSTSSVPPTSTVAETFVMPSLVGMVLQDAQDSLQAKGSYLLDQRDASGKGRLQILDDNWKVCSQSPAPGTKTSVSDMVTLSSVKLSERC